LFSRHSCEVLYFFKVVTVNYSCALNNDDIIDCLKYKSPLLQFLSSVSYYVHSATQHEWMMGRDYFYVNLRAILCKICCSIKSAVINFSTVISGFLCLHVWVWWCKTNQLNLNYVKLMFYEVAEKRLHLFRPT